MPEIKVSLCAFADEASASLDGQIAALKRNAVAFLEIRGVDGKNVSELSEKEIKEVAARLSDAGIRTFSIGSPIGKIRLDEDFEAHLDTFKRLCEYSVILGATRMRIFSFYAAEKKRFDTDAVFTRLMRICDAAPSELVLCHENEKSIFGDTPERCVEIFSALPRLKAVFDPANFVQCGVDTLKAWDTLHTFVDYIHIKDALRDGSIVPAGNGEGNVLSIISSYLAQGGEFITCEPHLQSFSGLSDLEHGEKTKIADCSLSNDEAFDLGVSSTKAIIEKIIKGSFH